MVAALDDAAVVQTDDCVGVAHGGQAVRDDKRRAALHELVHARLHDGLGAGVNARRGLVQNHRRRIGDGGACDRDQLALALRQLCAVAGEHRVVAR